MGSSESRTDAVSGDTSAVTEPPITTAEVAAVLLEKKASGTGGKTNAERQREWRERHKAKKAAANAPPPPPPPIGEDEVREAGIAFAFVWDAALVPLSRERLRELTEPQAMRAGKAFAPLVRKYLPMLADWQLEITAVLAVSGLLKAAMRSPEEYAEHLAKKAEMKAARDLAQAQADDA